MNVKPLKNFIPKIYISDLALNKMNEYIEQCSLEIGWLGCAERLENGIYISDVFLFKQEVHSATTEITTEGLNEFAMELMNTCEDGMEIWNNMRVWGHSHVNMPTSPSGQDDKQIEVFMENDNDFFIRIIGNKKGELRIDLYDFKVGIQYSELPYDVIYDKEKDEKIRTISNQIRLLRERLDDILKPEESLVKSINKEIASKVSEKKEVFSTGKYDAYGYAYNGYYGNCGKTYTTQSTKKEADTQKIIAYLNSLPDEEIFELMLAIETGSTSAEMLNVQGFTIYDYIELDDLIEEYCNENLNSYLNYVDEMYS